MEKDTKVKREVANIEIAYRNKKDLKELSSSKEFQDVVMKESFKGIKEAIDKKWKKVELFNIINLSVIIEIASADFPSALKRISKYFEINEEYEECAEIKKLIKKSKK
jgi:hypothetical protein|tara:strand:+ start:141 stop:464 length:324 start_codon:yes stop_codon:yes gene_type:complete